MNYTIPPLFPFPPFGSLSLIDTNLEVREHSLCGNGHGLKYAYFTWVCTNGTEIRQEPKTPVVAARPKCEPILTHLQDVEIDYDNCDSDDDSPIEGDVHSTVGGHLHG
jgi:hypothetical protein